MANKMPRLTEGNYAIWAKRAKVYMLTLDDEMDRVLFEGPIKIMQVATKAPAAGEATPDKWEEKPRSAWTDADRALAGLDIKGINCLYTAIGDNENLFNKIADCNTTKEIWDRLKEICEGSAQMKENQLSVAEEKFNKFKMLPNETLEEMDVRFTAIRTELASLGRVLGNREMVIKICRSMPVKYLVKTTSIRDSSQIDKMTPEEVFSALKAFEFEMNAAPDAPGKESVS